MCYAIPGFCRESQQGTVSEQPLLLQALLWVVQRWGAWPHKLAFVLKTDAARGGRQKEFAFPRTCVVASLVSHTEI